MTISFVNAGSVVTSVLTTLDVPYPASVTAGNILLLCIHTKYAAATPQTPSGWTQENQKTGGIGAQGNDSGDMVLTVFRKEASGSETGNQTVTMNGTPNTNMGVILQYSKTTGTWGITSTTGADASAGTNWSVTGAADPGMAAGDMVIAVMSQNGNLSLSWSSEAMSQTGITFGTMAERVDNASTSGSDSCMVVAEFPVSSGTSSAAPVFTMTGTGSGTNSPTGPGIIIRLREETSTPISGSDTASISATEGTPTIAGSSANSDTASVSISESSAIAGSSSQSDTATLSISESVAIAGSSEQSDTATLSITETAQVVVIEFIVASETASLAISESIEIVVAISATETASLSATEGTPTIAGSSTNQSDTATLSITESTALAGSSTSQDAASLGISEAVTIAGSSQQSDTATLSITETAQVVVVEFIAASETASLAINESAGITVAINVTDSVSLSISEHSQIDYPGVVNDIGWSVKTWMKSRRRRIKEGS